MATRELGGAFLLTIVFCLLLLLLIVLAREALACFAHSAAAVTVLAAVCQQSLAFVWLGSPVLHCVCGSYCEASHCGATVSVAQLFVSAVV